MITLGEVFQGLFSFLQLLFTIWIALLPKNNIMLSKPYNLDIH